MFGGIWICIEERGNDMAWMILLTILAAFAGGAVSTFFAEWLKGQFLNGKERQRILLFLSKEIESWIQNMQDICEGIIVNEGFGVWEGEAIASTLIEIPSLEKFIESHLFNKENDINLRDKALRLFRAINLYNAKYEHEFR